MPGMRVIRPADANESAQAWAEAHRQPGPTAIVLSRQGLPILDPAVLDVSRGATVVAPGDDAAIVATGSEVEVALGARDLLAKQGIAARVVSMPCMEIFRARSSAERAEVLPPGLPTVAVEAASPFGWHEFADDVVGLTRFGASAPARSSTRSSGSRPKRSPTRVTKASGQGVSPLRIAVAADHAGASHPGRHRRGHPERWPRGDRARRRAQPPRRRLPDLRPAGRRGDRRGTGRACGPDLRQRRRRHGRRQQAPGRARVRRPRHLHRPSDGRARLLQRPDAWRARGRRRSPPRNTCGRSSMPRSAARSVIADAWARCSSSSASSIRTRSRRCTRPARASGSTTSAAPCSRPARSPGTSPVCGSPG